ncbi:hypothetical protein [Jejubacter calystegiae]|nr:hypothetical protein [Jejubacter calystegiae]
MKSAHHKNRFIHEVIGVLMQRFRGDDKKNAGKNLSQREAGSKVINQKRR